MQRELLMQSDEAERIDRLRILTVPLNQKGVEEFWDGVEESETIKSENLEKAKKIVDGSLLVFLVMTEALNLACEKGTLLGLDF